MSTSMFLQAAEQPGRYSCPPPRLSLTSRPGEVVSRSNGSYRVDFGDAMFGRLRLTFDNPAVAATVVVHIGEKADADGHIDRQPPGTVRYQCLRFETRPGVCEYHLSPSAEKQNTGPAAIELPQAVGVVMPFRFVEVQCPEGVRLVDATQIVVHHPFDESAAHFACSDARLEAVWRLCRHTIKATSFCGIYVDGDRERIPYEGDAYINQLSHYACDAAYDMGSFTWQYLLHHPTWFADWVLHLIPMAWADYLYRGEIDALTLHYKQLIPRALMDLDRGDGLISTHGAAEDPAYAEKLNLFHNRYMADYGLGDLVDWPPAEMSTNGIGERDGYDMVPINTVVNALYYRAVNELAKIASVLGRHDDAERFSHRAARTRRAFHETFFDEERGIYNDGEGSSHASLHANMFPLAFGLTPESLKPGVVKFIQSRGMACSVYGAQYLLEALFEAGQPQAAIDLITHAGPRSWLAMIDQGSTMTLEAWGPQYKINLDWNHAWATAPLNIIPRRLFGIEPAEAGFRVIRLRPQLTPLPWAKIVVPTPSGPIRAEWSNEGRPTLKLDLPAGIQIDPADREPKQFRLEVN